MVPTMALASFLFDKNDVYSKSVLIPTFISRQNAKSMQLKLRRHRTASKEDSSTP
jgi:hypothetical protein